MQLAGLYLGEIKGVVYADVLFRRTHPSQRPRAGGGAGREGGPQAAKRCGGEASLRVSKNIKRRKRQTRKVAPAVCATNVFWRCSCSCQRSGYKQGASPHAAGVLVGRSQRLEYGGKAEGVDGEFGSVTRLATGQRLVFVNLRRFACGRLPSNIMCRFCITSKHILLVYIVLVNMRCSACGRLPSNRMCRFYVMSKRHTAQYHCYLQRERTRVPVYLSQCTIIGVPLEHGRAQRLNALTLGPSRTQKICNLAFSTCQTDMPGVRQTRGFRNWETFWTRDRGTFH